MKKEKQREIHSNIFNWYNIYTIYNAKKRNNEISTIIDKINIKININTNKIYTNYDL